MIFVFFLHVLAVPTSNINLKHQCHGDGDVDVSNVNENYLSNKRFTVFIRLLFTNV